MNRSIHFNYIEEKLNFLAYRIELRAKLNILDLNIHSENFYCHLFNKLFDLKLRNINETDQNASCIDLIDEDKKIVIQVSSTATKNKLETSLAKASDSYPSYAYKFISISKDATSLKKNEYKNINLTFNPTTDIYDIPSILRKIKSEEIGKIEEIYNLIHSEFKSESHLEKLETNLAEIIKIIAKENWSKEDDSFQIIPYEIDKKIEFNQLNKAKEIIRDYCTYNSRIDKIYQVFDEAGVNKSKSVLRFIRSLYLKQKDVDNPDEVFFNVIDLVNKKIMESKNYQPIAFEELDLCTSILVVDAFIECKIFENPNITKC